MKALRSANQTVILNVSESLEPSTLNYKPQLLDVRVLFTFSSKRTVTLEFKQKQKILTYFPFFAIIIQNNRPFIHCLPLLYLLQQFKYSENLKVEE